MRLCAVAHGAALLKNRLNIVREIDFVRLRAEQRQRQGKNHRDYADLHVWLIFYASLGR
jgi:hypothetical protein